MNPIAGVTTLLGLVAVATALGLLWRARTGRVRQVDSGATVFSIADLTADELTADAAAGSAATLLQFSTEVCAPCSTTRVLLAAIADERTGVSHVDIDVTARPDLAARFNLLQSPTTFILDPGGVVRARIGGAPRRAEVLAELDRIIGPAAAITA